MGLLVMTDGDGVTGLDAVVYKNPARASEGFSAQIRLVDSQTGEIEFVMPRTQGDYPLEDLFAVSARLGNISTIGWLAEEIRRRCPDSHLLLGSVLYSGSHSGDFISKEQLGQVSKRS